MVEPLAAETGTGRVDAKIQPCQTERNQQNATQDRRGMDSLPGRGHDSAFPCLVDAKGCTFCEVEAPRGLVPCPFSPRVSKTVGITDRKPSLGSADRKAAR